MTTNILRIAIVLSLTAVPAAAQSIPDNEKVLLPVALKVEVPGAHGSRWATRLSITNQAGSPAYVFGYVQPCGLGTCTQSPSAANVTFSPVISFASAETPGHFLLLEKQFADDIRIQLRAQDVSRQGQTWGTEIPVVRESEAHVSTLHLLDIPVTAEFRQTLRIYDFDPSPDRYVRVRIFSTNTSFSDPLEKPEDQLLYETIRSFVVPVTGGGTTYHPGYIEIDRFDDLVRDVTRVRVEIEPLSPELRFWAFVSVTNNETQHVTTITPQ